MFNMYNSYSQDNNYSPAIDDTKVIDFDTLQKARQDLIGEIQAVIEYDNHIYSTRDELARETWRGIRNEELVHIGELLGLLEYLAPYQKYYIDKGVEEFNMMGK